MLEALAESATHHGTYVTSEQARQVSAMVESSTGQRALVAARVHGALKLPTSSAVDLIIE